MEEWCLLWLFCQAMGRLGTRGRGNSTWTIGWKWMHHNGRVCCTWICLARIDIRWKATALYSVWKAKYKHLSNSTFVHTSLGTKQKNLQLPMVVSVCHVTCCLSVQDIFLNYQWITRRSILISKGSFGAVQKGTWRCDTVALRCIPIPPGIAKDQVNNQEIAALRQRDLQNYYYYIILNILRWWNFPRSFNSWGTPRQPKRLWSSWTMSQERTYLWSGKDCLCMFIHVFAWRQLVVAGLHMYSSKTIWLGLATRKSNEIRYEHCSNSVSLIGHWWSKDDHCQEGGKWCAVYAQQRPVIIHQDIKPHNIIVSS